MISIIAAIGKNRELGKDNELLWNIPGDLKRFRELTSGHSIIMGRKTYESIGRILPNRTNIIITRNKDFNVDGASVVDSLENAIKLAKESSGSEEIFVIGGGQIFEQAMAVVDRIYLTIVDMEYPDADVYFPEYKEFSKTIFEESHSDSDPRFKYINIEK